MMMVMNRLVLRVRLLFLGLFRALSRELEIPLPGAVGAYRGQRHELLEIRALALRAGGRVRAEHQQLEPVLALTAFVFVDWHGSHLRGRVTKS